MKKLLIQQIKLVNFQGKFKGISFYNNEKNNLVEYQTSLKMYEKDNVIETMFLHKSLVFPQLFSQSLIFVNGNNILQKSIISVRFLLKQIKFFIKGMNQMFFLEFRIAGLGYKVFKLKKGFLDLKILCLKLGYSHLIQYIFPQNVHLLIGRRHLFIYTNNYNLLKTINKNLFYIKKANPYKHKGLINIKEEIKLKIGKKQQR
jgi:ribosomal protein L6P/L9E